VVLCGVWVVLCVGWVMLYGVLVVALGVMWCDGVGSDGWPRGFIEMWCLEGSLTGLCHTRVIGLA
jgi:hypothetical protein